MPRKPRAEPTGDRLATAIELLQQFVDCFQSENRQYRVFGEVHMGFALDFHKQECS